MPKLLWQVREPYIWNATSATGKFSGLYFTASLSRRPYRLNVPKSVWVAALQEMAEEQKWDNFKNEVARRMGRDGAEYTDALHEVWRTMYSLQESETRQGWS
jgi:hypothetical protein